MKTIGVTGGVGAGKSTLLAFLEKTYGARVLRCDEIGHDLMEPGGACYGPVSSLFPAAVKEDGVLNRVVISQEVFASEEKREALDAIIHPAVMDVLMTEKKRQEEKGCPLFVVEAALLFEAGYEKNCDETWAVHVPLEKRIERLIESRGYTREKALSIARRQMGEEEFLSRADRVIENAATMEEAFSQADGYLMELGIEKKQDGEERE